jgi:O-antigen ligase
MYLKQFSPLPKLFLFSILLFVGLYIVSLFISMAGMEIFGWGTALCSIVLLFKSNKNLSLSVSNSYVRVIDFSLIVLLLGSVIGAVVNSPEDANTIDVIGRARWVLLYFLLIPILQVDYPSWFKKSMSYFLLFVLVVIFFYAFFQFFTGRDLIRGPEKLLGSAIERGERVVTHWRAVGFFGMSMTFGNSMGVVSGVLFGIFLGSSLWSQRFYLFGFAFVLAFISSFLSFQRGVWIGLGGLVVCLLIVHLKGIKRWVTLLMLTVLFVGVYSSVPGIQRRVDSIFELHSGSQSERIVLWQANWEIFKDYPIFGVGYGENENIVAPYLEKLGYADGFRGHAHNNFFQFLSGNGVVGFLAYILFSLFSMLFCYMVYRDKRFGRLERGFFLGVLGSQIFIHVGGLTECSFKDAEVNHQFIFWLALSRAIYLKGKF